jgi:hypothetical protein
LFRLAGSTTQVPCLASRRSQPGNARAIRLLNTLLLAEVTTKPAVMGTAGFGAGLDRGVLGPQSDALSVPRARLLVNVRAGQQLVMRPRAIRVRGVR